MKCIVKNGLGYLVFYNGTSSADGVPPDVITALDAGKSIKAIVKNLGASWSWQTGDCELQVASGGKHFLITSGAESKSANSS